MEAPDSPVIERDLAENEEVLETSESVVEGLHLNSTLDCGRSHCHSTYRRNRFSRRQSDWTANKDTDFSTSRGSYTTQQRFFNR